MRTVKVLKSGLIMGKAREFGDELPKDKFFALPINIQNSLIGANHVEIVDDEMVSDEDRFDAIEKRVKHLEGLIFQKPKVKAKPKSAVAVKGGTVKFLVDDAEITGKVTSVNNGKKLVRVVTKDDQKFAVSFSDIIT